MHIVQSTAMTCSDQTRKKMSVETVGVAKSKQKVGHDGIMGYPFSDGLSI